VLKEKNWPANIWKHSESGLGCLRYFFS